MTASNLGFSNGKWDAPAWHTFGRAPGRWRFSHTYKFATVFTAKAGVFCLALRQLGHAFADDSGPA